jgi:hypothetical protein
MKYAVAAVFVVFVLTEPLLAEPPLILEAMAGVETLLSCEQTHITSTCQFKHVGSVLPVTIGSNILLDGEKYFVEWIGPGYYLSTGVVVQPLGETAAELKGQLWLEVYPNQGKTHTSRAWVDSDGNQALSTSDTLALDSDPPVTVKDVRLQLRVRPPDPAP